MSGVDPNERMRRKDELVTTFLDRLDADKNYARENTGRTEERYAFREKAQVTFSTKEGDTPLYSVPTRNMSRGGMSFIMGKFVYPDTPCVVRLVSLHNQSQFISARVTRCQYLAGSGCLHEIGVKFDKPIDIAMFHRAANPLSVLLVDDDPGLRTLISRLLRAFTIEVQAEPTAKDGIRAASRREFDLILMDLDLPDTPGLDATRRIRDEGYLGPIVAVTARSDATVRQEALDAGCTDYLAKPLTRDALENLTKSLVTEPLVSTLMRDREFAGLINEFVGEMPRQVEGLRSAVRAKDFAALSSLARVLKGRAGSFGFEVISTAARQVEELAAAPPENLNALREEVRTLILLCQSARPATVTK